MWEEQIILISYFQKDFNPPKKKMKTLPFNSNHVRLKVIIVGPSAADDNSQRLLEASVENVVDAPQSVDEFVSRAEILEE